MPKEISALKILSQLRQIRDDIVQLARDADKFERERDEARAEAKRLKENVETRLEEIEGDVTAEMLAKHRSKKREGGGAA